MHALMASTLDRVIDEILQIQKTARTGGALVTTALADDRADDAEGMDRPESRRRPAGRRHVPLAPGAAERSGGEPRASRDAGGVDEELSARGAVRRSRHAADPSSPRSRRPAIAAWARIRTRTAALLLRDLRLPDFRDYAVAVPAPGAVDAEDTRVLGRFLRDVIAANDDQRQLPHLRTGRDGVEPARRGVRGDEPAMGRRDHGRTMSGWRRTAACSRC